MNDPMSTPEATRTAFSEHCGQWPHEYDAVLDVDPDSMRAFVAFARVPAEGGALSPKVRELIMIAVNASTTLLNERAIHRHMNNARSHGATDVEILEVLQQASVIGIHTCTMAMPVLMEELTAAGVPLPRQASDPAAIKEAFIRNRGWWSDFLETMLALSPDLLSTYVDYSSIPWQNNHIEPKVKELIYIAIDSQTTHLYEVGMRHHVRNALKLGATAEELVEVFALISTLGFHTMTTAVPLLADAPT